MKIKIKKLKINRILRLILITAAVMIFCAVSFLLYKEAKIPKIEEKTVKLYSYIHKSSTDYKVLLKPNSLYDGNIMGEGQYYITNYVEGIKNTFNYEFKGEGTAAIKGYYEIAAVVEGYTIAEKEHITIWEKKFSLVPKTDFSVYDSTLLLSESVDIKLSEYNAFAGAIMEESKVQVPVQLNVFMDVNLKAETNKASAEVKKTPAIIIPLDARYFKIAETDEKEVPGSIEETRKIQISPDKQKIRICIYGLAALAMMTLGLIIFSEPIRKSPFTCKLDKVFRQHGNRLVALSSELLAASLENCSIVKDIEDLVRISDEIGRPIMYEYCEDYKGMVHFYVLDDKRTYIYILRDGTGELNAAMADVRKIAF